VNEPQKLCATIGELIPYVTNSMWIGTMNNIARFEKGSNAILKQAINHIRRGLTDDIIHAIYDRYNTNPKIKWKAAIKKAINVDQVSMAKWAKESVNAHQ
jgi:hypothetical protein